MFTPYTYAYPPATPPPATTTNCTTLTIPGKTYHAVASHHMAGGPSASHEIVSVSEPATTMTVCRAPSASPVVPGSFIGASFHTLTNPAVPAYPQVPQVPAHSFGANPCCPASSFA